MQTALILVLAGASAAYLTRGLWRKKPAKKGCGNCSGCGCH